jgi:ubiquinone/menaquinone biosynthesis C-methylase UbiE
MSAAAVRLFTRLQNAQFYRDLHRDAGHLVAERPAGRWLDIGCGPGLWAGLAAEQGHQVLGVDRDPDMVDAARKSAGVASNNPAFAVGDTESLLASGERFDVVSASSLIVVTPDPARTLEQLVELTGEGGVVLVLEASPQMSRIRALGKVLFGRLGPGAGMLLLWSGARSGRALPHSLFERPGWRTMRRSLLGGMVNAWLVARQN